MPGLKAIFATVKRWAKDMYYGDEEPEISEVCDFGDAYGFLFVDRNKYDNVYWCVRKKDYKPFAFRPVQDPEKFKARKVLKL